MSEAKSRDASFSPSWAASSSAIAITFERVDPGVASVVRVNWGTIAEGRDRGDGIELVNVNRDLRVVMYDHTAVDPTSVVADLRVPLMNAQKHGVLFRWRDSPRGEVQAIGLLIEDGAAGLEVQRLMHGAEAVSFMKEAQVLRNDRELPKGDLSAGASFSALSVMGYRGFAQERTLALATPTGALGSGLTVVVGANNSGKSTFLEALQLVARAKMQTELTFPQPRRHRDKDFVRIALTRSDGTSLVVESIREGGSQARTYWSPKDDEPTKFDIHVTPSRRQFSPYFGYTGVAGRDWGLVGQEFSRTELREQFVGRLRHIDRNAVARESFDELLFEIVGHELTWTIDEIATNQQFLKLIEEDGAWHTSEGLGDGLVSLLFIVDALYDSEPGSLIAIDEPELSLHPQLVRRLRVVLSRYAADRQILIATHSPYLVDWSDVRNGASVARIFKAGGKSEIAQASREALEAVARLSDTNNLRNPHAVGTVAKEALFLEDGVLLTEGQDDVAYLPGVFDDLQLPHPHSVYGWGAGGVGNIPKIAKLFLELGFTRVAALLDSDGQEGTAAAVRKLEDLGPEVMVRQIPAPDIRHKEAVEARDEVRGLLDEGNERVRPELREAARSVLQELLEHINPEYASR